MNRYRVEPHHRHDTASQTGVLLVNLGTPDAPTPQALRRYLAEFLSDTRVVEIPKPIWKPLLHGIILRTRPSQSARKYASIWTPEGSPLRIHTERQAKLLRGWLGQAGFANIIVSWAMRYGSPSISTRLDELKASGCTRILIVPLYPQYAGSATGSAMDAVAEWMRSTRNLPELRFVRSFYDNPGYIDALDASVREHWMHDGKPEKLVISFHGVPRATLDKGDPYHCECQKTARLLGESLGLRPADDYVVAFQSRFGRAQWLEPATLPTLQNLAKHGTQKLTVICPGFVSDCLETLEEIGMECKTAFLAAGGKAFHFIPCLNEQPRWIAALGNIVLSNLDGWTRLPEKSPDTLTHTKHLAMDLGAKA